MAEAQQGLEPGGQAGGPVPPETSLRGSLQIQEICGREDD